MSATIKCDICGRMIDGKEVTTPRLRKTGDIEPEPENIAIGYNAWSSNDPVLTDEQALSRVRSHGNVPGYPILMRGVKGMVKLWVTWREEEDFCEACIKKAIREKAYEIEKDDPLGCMADI